jgi:hypothetical protein
MDMHLITIKMFEWSANLIYRKTLRKTLRKTYIVKLIS